MTGTTAFIAFRFDRRHDKSGVRSFDKRLGTGHRSGLDFGKLLRTCLVTLAAPAAAATTAAFAMFSGRLLRFLCGCGRLRLAIGRFGRFTRQGEGDDLWRLLRLGARVLLSAVRTTVASRALASALVALLLATPAARRITLAALFARLCGRLGACT